MKVFRRFAVAVAVALLLPTLAYAFVGQAITGNVIMNAAFTESVSTGVINPYSIPANISLNLAYSNGTASSQVDTLYAKSITLAASTTTLDLTSLTDPAGNSINFARVREFIIMNPDATAGHDVKVSAGASNGWAVLPPAANALNARNSNGTLRISDPVSTGASTGNVTSGTSKTVLFDPSANTVTIFVMIVGGSAAFVFIPFGLRRFRTLSA